MKLTSLIKLTSKYKGKSKLEFFQNLEPGDFISVEYELTPASKYGDMFAAQIKLRKMHLTDISITLPVGNLLKYLQKIDYYEL